MHTNIAWDKVENPNPQSTPQVLLLFEEYTPPVTYPKEVKETLGSPIEVEPLNETKLEEVGLNCNHNTPLSAREVTSFDGLEPQPLLNNPSLDVSLGDVIGPEPPINPHSPDSSRIKVVDYLTTQTPPSPHMENSHHNVSEGSPITTTERIRETYKNVSQDIRDQLNAEAKAVQIILTGIDNDIYSTVDACPNAREMWKAIERNRGKSIVNSPQPIYDQEPSMVNEDDETSKDKEIDKLMALISLSFKKIYKPTNNNLRTSSNISRANQDNSPRINRNAGYENQRIGNVAGARENVGSSVVQKSGIQCYNCKEFRHENLSTFVSRILHTS
uniref:Ribonuclease H-like domain-containing protein n=1 Tax=Tanacetum cinerariifolium TaxID=118510 RepID=A0A699II90_TANCI|nr:ribonuclease H-like domain-containing protein [Tanacetum cinerariifolium]